MRENFRRRLEEHKLIAQKVEANPQGIDKATLAIIVGAELDNLSKEAGTSLEA